ncbi:serine/threonine-protein phosphatase [Salpingoeca rosetta]|uniref:Serine/threonine-protein phosphatase n=1 Tax=Salpingoeca rosetta (strain ATCC 50818 / BSB-021) TaxID=946362 RepID=F2TYG9_SALR5|nr:serine/threonine-protein phosphatase [Salpingoeca rosetta]EGD78643.1 serine/threonine-protein phosphatase [Salpingoeca rosetta]|eukprot:XP_004997601.1 serine/threonine-protein phosphatase [Salpingoeca rosetta]
MSFRRSRKGATGASSPTASKAGTSSRSPSPTKRSREKPSSTSSYSATMGSSSSASPPTGRRSVRTSSLTSPSSHTPTKQDPDFRMFSDVMGRRFQYNPKTNVAVLDDSFRLWPRTLGPIELSTRASGTQKRLSAKFRELDRYGCVHRHDYLPGLTPGTVDRQHSKNTGLVMKQEIASRIRDHKATGGAIKEVALQAMTCLEYFLPVVVPYHYETAKPSHMWTTDDTSTNYCKELFTLLPALCAAATQCLQNDDMLVELSSPCYVLGDLHGNFRDLQYFSANFWRAGVDICPADLLFLGDYVDRGPHSTELIAYLLALKVLYPKKVFLLRGNHELESVCGNTDYYGEGSFRSQLLNLAVKCNCLNIFDEVWQSFMTCFEWMPLAATIDSKIFCCHAGLPRALMMSDTGGDRTILERIKDLQRPLKEEDDIDTDPECVAMDILWADPASHRERGIMGMHGMPPGFALNLDRGGDACVFGEDAVAAFKEQTGCDFILRAHQPPDKGIRYQAGAKVITVFSSSHYCGMNNSAALIVVSEQQLDIVTTGETVSEDKRSTSSSRAQTPAARARRMQSIAEENGQHTSL